MAATDKVIITECPRDAMQGLHHFVPTEVKAAYINLLLQVGFEVIDFGSFVSHRAIPQMQDTAQVLAKLDMSGTRSKLLAIIANYRGAEDAVQHPEITYLGFPLSISETFQQRNTNASIDEAFETVKRIQELSVQHNKKLLVYLSMGFGNPYGDDWSEDIVLQWTEKLIEEGIQNIALADTVGVATPQQISSLYPMLTKLEGANFGLHLHSTPNTTTEKITAAWQAGCRHFDTALKGYGGCPMAKDDLTGNIATESVITYLQNLNIATGLDRDKFNEAMAYSSRIFL